MTKFDVYSDLHLDSWARAGFPADEMRFLKSEDCNAALFAGDAGNGPKWYEEALYLLRQHYKKVIGVPGNHDFYKNWLYEGMINLEQYDPSNQYYEINGVKIVTATLWTNFRHSEVNKEIAEASITDFRLIKGMTGNAMETLCHNAFTHLAEFAGKVDIVMTHFPPIVNSVHPAYAAYAHLNPYFVNDEPEFFKRMGAKYWIHGHSHKKFDYDYGGCRVVANPIGYAGEEQREPVFIPKTIEVT